MEKLFLQSDLFTRGVEDIVTRAELGEMLKSGRKLRIKLGIDPTAPDLHIGHAVPLWKIRGLQEVGHKAVIILGDFTIKIGDPTGRSAARILLKSEIVRKNIASQRKQIERILLTDPKVYELRKNSEWWGKMKAENLLQLTGMITHARLVERDMFQERMRHRKEIIASEILYPILQGYDSVAIKSDLTIIGSDQLFNEHMGRFFQEKFEQRPQAIVTLKILPGLDGGEKMSKSLGNYIGLAHSPQDKFGKAMRLNDSLIVQYLEVYTDTPMAEVRRIERDIKAGKNPMQAKLFLAEALVRRYHGAEGGRKARQEFMRVFSQGKTPSAMPVMRVKRGTRNIAGLLVEAGLAPSKSEARRLLAQGGVTIDGRTYKDPTGSVEINKETVLMVGKRRFVRIVPPQ